MKIIKKSKLNTHVYQYKNSKGTFWGYRLRYYDENGKRREKTRNSFKTEHEAITDYFNLNDKISTQPHSLSHSELTLSQWFDKYLGIIQSSVDVSTFHGLENHFRTVNRLIGHVKLSELTLLKYQTLYLDKIKHLAPSTQKNYHLKIHAALNVAVSYNIIEFNPISKARLPKNFKTDDKRYLETEELNFLLDYCKNNLKHTHYLFILLLTHSGMRLSECLALTWNDLNFNDHTVSISKTVKGKFKHRPVGKTKGRNIRVIKIDENVMNEFKRYKSDVIKIHFRYRIPFANDTFVFNRYYESTKRIVPFNSTAIDYIFKKFNEKYDTNITAHDLRHTHASYLLANNIPPTTVAKRLGHTVNVLLKTYAHAIPSKDDAAVTAFNNLLGQKLGEEK